MKTCKYKVKITTDGDVKKFEEYFKDGKLHREDGAARIWYYKNRNKKYEHYYKHGKIHREDGAAWIWYDKNGNKEREAYYIDGKKLTKEQFNNYRQQILA